MKRSLNIWILFVLANLLWANGLRSQTIDSLLKIVNNNTSTVRASAFLNLGQIYKDEANYNVALSYFYKALKDYETTNSKKEIGVVCNNIGEVLERNFEENKAITYFKKALSINTDVGNKYEIAHSLSGIGNCNEDLEKYDSALYYYNLALNVCVEAKNKNGISNVTNDIVGIYTYLKQYSKAIQKANTCLTIDMENKDTAGIAVDFNNIGNNYLGWGKIDTAIIYFNKGVLIAQQIKNPYLLATLYKNIARAYEKTGNYKEALVYHKLFTLSNDSVFNADKTNAIVEMQNKYEAEKKDKDISVLENKNSVLQAQSEKRNLYTVIAVGCCLFLLTLFLVVNRNKKKQRELEMDKNKAVFELQALMAQMNPHFIFNALNSIQHYILERSKQEAYDYLAKFSKLIRIVLNNSEEKIIPLQRELEMIQLYIDLEQMRFANKFEFNLSVAENINVESITMPTMLIQPYIENAIWHGLMNLERENKRVLKVEITKQDKHLKIVVEDNGIGRVKAAEYKTKDMHKPVAMKLTEKRLAMINKMKGYENTKVIIADLHDEKGAACGTRVEILLPI